MSGTELPPETGLPPEDNGDGEQPAQPQNPLLGALLGSMAGGSFDPMSLLMSQISSQTPNDPRMALLTQFLSQRHAPPEIEGEAKEVDPEAREIANQQRLEVRRQCARRIRELRVLAKKMYAELELLRERNDTLAAALGACYICFGTDQVCPECAGRGLPGSANPDPDTYREYVQPAVRREQWLKTERERRAQRYMDPRQGDPRQSAAGDAVVGRIIGRPADFSEGRVTA
jgi:hypothetical protein